MELKAIDFFGILFFVYIISVYLNFDFQGTTYLRLHYMALLVMSLSALVFFGKTLIELIGKAQISVLFFIYFSILHLFYFDFEFDHIIGFLKYGSFVGLFSVGYILIKNDPNYRILKRGFSLNIFCIVLEAIIAFFQFIFKKSEIILNGTEVRVSGTLNNYLAQYILFGIICVWFVLINLEDKKKDGSSKTLLLLHLMMGLLLSILLIVNVRTCYILFGIFLLLELVKSFSLGMKKQFLKRGLKSLIGGALVLITMLGMRSYSNIGTKAQEFNRSLGTAEVRVILWKSSIKMGVSNPFFGVGFNGFGRALYAMAEEDSQLQKVLQDYKLPMKINAHSQFFTMFAELGAFWGVILFCLVIYLFCFVLRCYFISTNLVSSFFCIWLSIGLLAFLVSDPFPMAFFWLAVGAFLGLYHQSKIVRWKTARSLIP